MSVELDSFLPGKIERFLDDNGIPHRSMKQLPDNSQNLTFTDFDSVFVKVLRRPEGKLEVENTLIALEHGMPAPRPLLENVSWCSVWEFKNLFPFRFEHLPEALGHIKRLHDATEGAELIPVMDYSEQLEVIVGRFRGNKTQHWAQSFICELSEELCDKIARHTEGEPTVFTHGDLQFTNMGLDHADHPVIFDWEISKSAPRELEIAKTEGNLMERDLWRPRWWASMYGPLDDELLFLASQLRFCQNIAFDIERGATALAEHRIDTLKYFFKL